MTRGEQGIGEQGIGEQGKTPHCKTAILWDLTRIGATMPQEVQRRKYFRVLSERQFIGNNPVAEGSIRQGIHLARKD